MSKNTPIQKIILKILARKNVVSLEDLKREALKSLKIGQDVKNKTEYAISRSLKNLSTSGLLDCFQSDRQPFFRLSEEGRKRINSNALDDDTAIISKNWDGNWRIIILDLPEERKNEREALRYLLKKAGFVCVKNSVWISIYPYENLFTNIKNDLGLTTEMIILVTNKIDEATRLELLKNF
jgi:DNA-binding transcriptional regulator PaaX